MDNIQESAKTAGRPKVARAVENSTVSKDGVWRTFKEVPWLAQRKAGMFYVPKRIDGEVYRRSLETHVFSIARARIPKKVQQILDEIANAAKADASAKPDAAQQVVPVTVGDGINKSLERVLRRLEANQLSRKPTDFVLKAEPAWDSWNGPA